MRVLPLAQALACIGAIAAIATPRVAGADGAGVIAANGGEHAEVAAAMIEAMRGRSPRIVPEAVAEARIAVANGVVPVETLARFRSVREQVDEGWRAYLRVAVENARLRLQSARTEAEALVALPGGAEVYADAALRLGVVLGHLGRREESQAVLALALALDPDRPITLAEFSPDVIAAIDAVRALPVSKQKLRVTTEPPGAQVDVDDTDVGKSPVDAVVTRGQHVIVARLPLHRPAVQGVAVDHETSLALDLPREDEVTSLSTGAERGLPEAAAQVLIDATLRYADLDEVIVAAETLRHGGPTLLVQRCAGVPARCSALVDIGYGDRAGLPAAAKEAWETVRAGELRYPPTVLVDRGSKPVTTKCRWCRSPLVWTGVAVVVTGVVVAIVVSSGTRPPPVLSLTADEWTRP